MLLLNEGASIDLLNERKENALHFAAANKSVELCVLLLEKGIFSCSFGALKLKGLILV